MGTIVPKTPLGQMCPKGVLSPGAYGWRLPDTWLAGQPRHLAGGGTVIPKTPWGRSTPRGFITWRLPDAYGWGKCDKLDTTGQNWTLCKHYAGGTIVPKTPLWQIYHRGVLSPGAFPTPGWGLPDTWRLPDAYGWGKCDKLDTTGHNWTLCKHSLGAGGTWLGAGTNW